MARSSKPARSTEIVGQNGTKNGHALAPYKRYKPGALVTSQDFKRFLTEVTASARAGTVDVRIVGATCNAIGKILKIQEMEFKYGHRTAKGVAVSRTLNMLA